MPYLREARLAASPLCETLKTATKWSNIPALKTTVTDALTSALTALGTTALVICHVSHVYPSGVSLYCTVVAEQRDNPIEQWRASKKTALDAIMATGGNITHNRAVHADHRPWMHNRVVDLGYTSVACDQCDVGSGRNSRYRQADSVTQVRQREIAHMIVLTNPLSGHGNAIEAARHAINWLRQHDLKIVEIIGDDAENTRYLADTALEKGTDAVVVTGGDDAISNALQVLAGNDILMGIIPAGTGKDHARKFNIPTKDPEAAANIIVDGWTETFDLSKIQCGEGSKKWYKWLAL